MELYEPCCASCSHIFPGLDAAGKKWTYDCRFRPIILYDNMVIPLLEPCDHYVKWEPLEPSVIKRYILSDYEVKRGMRRSREYVRKNPLIAIRAAYLARCFRGINLFRSDGNGCAPSIKKVRCRVENWMHHDGDYLIYVGAHLELYGVIVFN